MELLIVSFVAGVLTAAAPCILPLLPVIIGGTLVRSGGDKTPAKHWYRPLVIAISLAVSVIIFSLLLKATTALLGVSQMFWQVIAGFIVLMLGINLLWPVIWERISLKTGLYLGSNKFLSTSYSYKGLNGDVLTGLALGPVFNSCSPTYVLIVAAILPVSFWQGFVYLVAYAVGLAGALLVIAYAGQSAVQRLGWLSNPGGWFRRVVGILFIVVGLSVVFGLDKKAQAFVLDRGWYRPIEHIERSFTR